MFASTMKLRGEWQGLFMRKLSLIVALASFVLGAAGHSATKPAVASEPRAAAPFDLAASLQQVPQEVAVRHF